MALKNSDFSLAHIRFPVQLIGNSLPCCPSGTRADGAATILKLLVTRGKELWRVLQQQLNAWFANATCYFCAPFMVRMGHVFPSRPCHPSCWACCQQTVPPCQPLQECVRCRAAPLPRAPHIQWLLQVGHQGPATLTQCGTTWMAILASEILVGSAQSAVGQTRLLLLPSPSSFSFFLQDYSQGQS